MKHAGLGDMSDEQFQGLADLFWDMVKNPPEETEPTAEDRAFYACEVAAEALRDSIRGMVRAARVRRENPRQEVAEVRRRLEKLEQCMSSTLVDDREYRADRDRGRAALRLVGGLTEARVKDITSRALTIAPDDLPDALFLLLIASPSSAAYWVLARQVRDHVESLDMRDPKNRWHKAALGAMIAPRDYAGENTIASPPRGASHATELGKVNPCGAPGLGKRP